MTSNKNFMWLEEDIRDTLVLKVIYREDGKEKLYGIFEVLDVLETTGEQLDIETANIDDLTNMISYGVVRFVNVVDNSDIVDIPLRKLNILYARGNMLGDTYIKKMVSFRELDAFSIIDGAMKDDLEIVPALINKPSDDLYNVMKIASNYWEYGMQEKFDALSDINLINHRRLMRDNNENKIR